MKVKIFLVIAFLTIAASSFAQFRHIKGVKSIEAGAGISKYGLLYNGSYIQYLSRKVYGKATIFFEKGKDSGIEFSSTGGDLAVAYNFLKLGEGVYINGISGLTMAMDKVTRGAESYDISNKFKVGALFGAEVEVFITDKIVFVVGADQRIVLGSEFGNYRAYYRGGIRFNF